MGDDVNIAQLIQRKLLVNCGLLKYCIQLENAYALFVTIQKSEQFEIQMEKIITVKDLIVHLIESGYRYSKPKSPSWKSAFTFKYKDSVLCVLLRKNGIDLRYYEKYSKGIFIHPGNFISMSGGEIFRNHYNESSNLINQKIKVIADSFVNGKVLNALRTQDGRSYLLNSNYPNIRAKSKKEFDKKYRLMQEKKDERLHYGPHEAFFGDNR